MLYRVLYVIINFLMIFLFVNCEGIVKKSEKRPDSDLQSCYDGFVIHKDKIIRTQDSQQMGAKYLTEIDVNSESDCIRFCCVTDQCDVFVFEEKKPGSCYLFHCGPPQDFKCKFTDHANYSSAVLTNYKQQTALQLEEQIRKTPEHELKSLRKHVDPGVQEYSYNESPPVVVTQVTKAAVVTTPAPVKPVCSRNQFECRTTGDCIAIYNVCDGIPQCSDGSDEAAELHCPTEKPFPAPPPVVVQKPVLPSLPDVLRYQQMLQHHKSYAPLYGHVQESNPKSWQPSGSTHQVLPPQQNLPYPVDTEIVPQTQSHASYGSQGYPWNYQPYYEQNKEGYNGYNYPLHEQNSVPVYEQQPHIFNHKRPGVIEETAPDGNVDQSRSFVPYYQQPNHETWPEKQPQPHPSVAPIEHHVEPEVVPQSIKTTSTPQPCKTPEKDANVTTKNDSNEANKSKNPKVIEVEHKDESTTKTKPVAKGHASVKIIEVKKEEDPQVDHKILEDHLKEAKKETLVAQHFRFNSNVNENLRPKGAVISLALGLSVSAVMAILIACRLRVVRRRGRRGHEPYAHDADYLVNGMYL